MPVERELISARSLLAQGSAVRVRYDSNIPVIIIRLCAENSGLGVWIRTDTLAVAQDFAARINRMLQTASTDSVYNQRVQTLARMLEEDQAVETGQYEDHPFATTRMGQTTRAAELQKIIDEVGLLK